MFPSTCDYEGSNTFDIGYGDCSTYDSSNAGYCSSDGACNICCECDVECGISIDVE